MRGNLSWVYPPVRGKLWAPRRHVWKQVLYIQGGQWGFLIASIQGVSSILWKLDQLLSSGIPPPEHNNWIQYQVIGLVHPFAHPSQHHTVSRGRECYAIAILIHFSLSEVQHPWDGRGKKNFRTAFSGVELHVFILEAHLQGGLSELHKW